MTPDQFAAAMDKLLTSPGETAENLEQIKAGILALAEPTPDQALNAAYRERAHLVALLAALYPSHIGYTDPAEPGWAVVTIETPAGQLSWHIAPGDLPLFEHVQPTSRISRGWDGHTTDEKYERVRRLTGIATLVRDDEAPADPTPEPPAPTVLSEDTHVTWTVDFQNAYGYWYSPAWSLDSVEAAEAALAKYLPQHPGQPWRIVKCINSGSVELVKDSTTPGQ